MLRKGIRTWITGTDFNRAIQSVYGRREFQTTTQPVNKTAKAFGKSVDTEAVKKVVEELGNLKRERQSREGPNGELRAKDARLREKAGKVTDEHVRRLHRCG
jgi:hypothetical protein